MTKLHLFIFALFFAFVSSAQSTSESYLVSYGQVWGFLKYFHPQPGKMNWDEQLLRDYDRVKSCTSQKEFNSIIDEIIWNCGDYKAKERNIKDYGLFTESMEWLDSENFSEKNKEAMRKLYLNKPKFANKYMKSSRSQVPHARNEIKYWEAETNEAVRYLAITRYWNIINYYCPNRSIITKNWTDVYLEQLPHFTEATTAQAFELAVIYLSNEIEDGHGYLKIDGQSAIRYKYLPFNCETLTEGTFLTFVSSDSSRMYNLERLDKIISLDGLSIDDYWIELDKRIPSSNFHDASNSNFNLIETLKDSVSMTVERNGNLITETLYSKENSRFTPKEYHPILVHRTGIYTDSISDISYGYLDMGKLKQRDLTRSLKASLKTVDHLIINSRNYPNETIFALGRLLIKGKHHFAQFRRMNIDFPGSYSYDDGVKIGGFRKGFSGKIYLLVNNRTISQAEYTVMALQQHPHAVTIGEQSAGADGDITQIAIGNGINTNFSGLGVLYPDGTDTQQAGVKIDIEVGRTFEDLKNLNDSSLNNALELIRNSKN